MRGLITGMVVLLGLTCGRYTYADYTWYSSGGHEYALTLTHENWATAEAEAESLGGHLVTINSQDELAFVSSTFQDAYSLWYGPDSPSGRVFWTGLEKAGDTWQWVTGEPFNDFPPVYSGAWHPTNGGLHAYLHSDGHQSPRTLWNDNDVDSNPSFYTQGVIEIPEPSTFVLFIIGTVSVLGCAWRRKAA
jgi:hypothetical protein